MNLESTVLIQELKRFSKFTYGTGTAGITARFIAVTGS
jgi:hypothetical protein